MHPWALLREGLICLRGVCAGLLVVCRRARGVAPQKREGNALYTDGAVGRAVLKSLFCEKRASERVSTESIKPLISMGGETRQMSASLSLTAPHTQTPSTLAAAARIRRHFLSPAIWLCASIIHPSFKMYYFVLAQLPRTPSCLLICLMGLCSNSKSKGFFIYLLYQI